MKKYILFILVVLVSNGIFAIEPLDSLPCYCVDLVELMGGNDETELSEEDVKAFEEDNIYFSERKGCLAKFLVPVKPKKQVVPKEKPLPLFVAQKLGRWGYMNAGRNSFAQSYMAEAKCYTVGMGRELYAQMQNDTALARPFFNFIYEYYYGRRNEQIRVYSLHNDMGFTYPEIDQMEEIGYAHYKVLEYQREHPYISREDLIKEGFEAEKALESGEIKLEEWEKNPYYKGKLTFDSCAGIEGLMHYLSECAVALQSPCHSKILVHVNRKGLGSFDCDEVDDGLVNYFCDYASKNCGLVFKPAYLFFPNIKAKVRVPCTTYIYVTERRDFDRIAIVKVVFKDNKWEFAPDTQLPVDWKMGDLINSIREQLAVGKTKKTKLTLQVQMIKRKVLISYLGEYQLASIYQVVSSNDKNLQFESYSPSNVRW